MLSSEVEIVIDITCDICGYSFRKKICYESDKTDYISLHNLEDKYLEDQSFNMENNVVYCSKCYGRGNVNAEHVEFKGGV